MRTFNAEGIVIKRMNVGEADRILTIFTRRHGKIRVKAKGVRKINSKRSPHLELLNFSRFVFHEGRVMPFLVEAQSYCSFDHIKDDLTKVGFAYHLCELIDGLCPENADHPLIFNLFYETLHKLQLENDIASIIHGFEVELLTLLGFWPKNNYHSNMDTTGFIEGILEHRLFSRRLLFRLK